MPPIKEEIAEVLQPLASEAQAKRACGAERGSPCSSFLGRHDGGDSTFVILAPQIKQEMIKVLVVTGGLSAAEASGEVSFACRRSSTGEVSLSIRSHVARVLSHRK